MSPYYADPTRPAGVRWVNPDVCGTCDDPVPVAARQGVPHPLGELLCLAHLLEVLGVANKPPAAPAPVNDGAVRATFRASLRVPSPRPDPTSAVTLARQAPPQPLEPEVLEAVVLTMGTLGAIPLRTERTFGTPVAMGCHWRPSTAERKYDPGRPVAWDLDDERREWPAGVPVEPDDEAVPSSARTLARAALKASWGLRLLSGPQTFILRAVRGPVVVLARYEKGRHAAGWLRVAGGPPTSLTGKQLAEILRRPGA